ncbi:unnamed protein product [Prorocentrum cordatum]|uniref:non-specific serine/threonine protein kinase n=1 Tax=Prorocentrum cordatum TaxID=2364126 RepID=A0ABN9XTT0_9DINO|nr:unnamed protein product [Polarella glacialis]
MATFASLGLASLESHGLEAVSRLGGGAAAEVLLACRLGRPEELCVVKTVALRGLDSRGRLRALQEVQALKKLRHPNVAVYLQSWWNGVGPNSGRLTTVTEYAEDGDLRAPLAVGRARDEALEGPVVAGWLQQILQGLEHSPRHRPSEPEAGQCFPEGTLAHLLAFGLRRPHGAGQHRDGCCLLWRPTYSAPELLWNQRCSPAADLWAAGVILHELLALRLPFEAPSAVELVRQVAFAPLELCGRFGL